MLDISELLRECCNLSLSGSDVRCDCRLSENLPHIAADRNQLAQLFSNLLINARQAMPDGGTITVTAANRAIAGAAAAAYGLSPGDYLEIVLRDQGVGIPETIINRIFDPFFTTKQEGSGLGLAICFSIVNRHSGHTAVSSAPGKGTVVTVLLPLGANAPVDTEEHVDRALLKGTGRILVMDDEPGIRELARALLTSAGYTVVTVTDGSAAVEKYRAAFETKKHFDLVILDLTVPGGMGGEQAIAELRKIDPAVTAVVSSGYADNQVLANHSDYGFAGMVAKPYKSDELLLAVKKAMGKKGK